MAIMSAKAVASLVLKDLGMPTAGPVLQVRANKA